MPARITKKRALLIGVDAVVFPIVQKFIKEGHLPNFKRLLEEGAGSEAACCIPPYTPTNWATLSTGALPDTHGAGNWVDNLAGELPGPGNMSTFDSRCITAETIWEAAERAGLKSMCVAYPTAYPKRTKNSIMVAPLHRGLVTLLMIRGSEYATSPKPGGVAIGFKPATGWRNAPAGSLESEIVVQEAPSKEGVVSQVGATEDGAAVQQAASVSGGVTFNLLLVRSKGKGFDKALLCDGKDAGKPVAGLKAGKWSDWIIRVYAITRAPRVRIGGEEGGGGFVKTDVDILGKRPGSTRFKLLHMTPDGKDVRLVRSEVYPVTDFTDPASLSEELVREVGPYYEHSVGRLSRETMESDMEMLDTVLDDMRYQALWHPKAAKYVMDKYGWDIYYLHWHWPDTVGHQALRPIEPDAPGYDPQKAPLYWNVIRRSYQIMDEMVGEFLKVAGKNGYVIVVSDHGNTPDYRAFDISRYLAQKGLCAFRDNSYALTAIDFSKAKAYRSGAFHISVNLKGRNPFGCVEPKDYEKVQEEVVDVLQTWRDPANGKLVMAFALKKRDAQLIGYWGERTGDVVFVANNGYWWGDGSMARLYDTQPGATIVDTPYLSAHHGPKMPTDRTSMTSNMSSFFIRGPGIKAGYSRDPEKRGFVRLLDIVPTIAHLMGFLPPRTCEGSVLWDHFTDGKYEG
jgi:predicted AlkP superfamily phosphohydrolase/phosphomutase